MITYCADVLVNEGDWCPFCQVGSLAVEVVVTERWLVCDAGCGWECVAGEEVVL